METFKILKEKHIVTGTDRNLLDYGSYIDTIYFQIDEHKGVYEKKYHSFYGMTTYLK